MRLDTGERRRSLPTGAANALRRHASPDGVAVLAARGFKTASMQLLRTLPVARPVIATQGEGTSMAGEARTD
jgi:hypothetical protein